MNENKGWFADDDLVGRAQAGEIDAFTELAGRIQEKVYHTILGMTRNQVLEMEMEGFADLIRIINRYGN